MRSILVVSKEQEPSHTILECFGRGYRVDKASTQDAAMEMLRKKRYDFVFIDVEIFRESVPGNGYKAALQLFWHVHPSIEIIVMSSQDMIRKALKAEASNYLTYPASADEVKYVTESVQESLKEYTENLLFFGYNQDGIHLLN